MRSFQTPIQVAHLPYSKSILLVVLNYYQFSVIHWQIAKVWDNFLRFPARCIAFRLSVCLVLFNLERSRPTATIGSHCPNHDPSGINISYALYLLQNCATSHGTQKLNPLHCIFLQTPTSVCKNRITMDTVLWNEASAAIMIIRRNWHSYVCYNETTVHRQSKNPPSSSKSINKSVFVFEAFYRLLITCWNTITIDHFKDGFEAIWHSIMVETKSLVVSFTLSSKHKVKLKTCSPQQPHPHISACESIYLDLIVEKCIRKQPPTVLCMNFQNASRHN